MNKNNIEQFPGELGKKWKPNGKYTFNLTKPQQEWLTKYYPGNRDWVLSQMMGCPASSISRFARELGLSKAEGFTPRSRYTAAQYGVRWQGKQLGYIIDRDPCHVYAVFYDQHTARDEGFERQAQRCGIEILEWNG